jgi:ubiquinone/menaquinone biosynthesis C-methylase UbiE
MQTPEELAAELYDLTVPDWDGELDFYRDLSHNAGQRGLPVLEVASGTGRVAIRLAEQGIHVTGIDLSPEMLAIAMGKSTRVRWIQADMRSFDLGESFGLIIVPAHSFQFMLTPDDQVQALETFHRHLEPDGVLVIHLDHQSVDWLGDLLGELAGKFEGAGEVIHPRSGRLIRRAYAWTYEPSTQTATIVSRWEQVGEDGSILQTWTRQPMLLHCVFRFEMEHLAARTGFEVQALYGDFFKGELTDQSTEMIWVLQKRPQ